MLDGRFWSSRGGMAADRGRRALRRLGVAAAMLLASGAAACGGEGGARTLPEGGSQYGSAAEGHRAGGTSLIDALAPVLSGRRGAGGRRRGLPAPAARAAARLFLIGFPGTGPSPAVVGRLRAHDWGGVVLQRGNGTSTAQLQTLVDRVRAVAASARNQAPLVAADQPGGADGAVPDVPPAQASAADAAQARGQAAAAGRGLRRLGFQLVLAPVADLGAAGGPWEGRAFSDDAPTVARMAGGAVAGWQEARVAAAPGHFPGEGAASGDPALGAATVGLSLDELRAADLRPFVAVADTAPAVQLSSALYAAWDGVTPATLMPEVVRLLRGEVGFKGVVISGDLAAASLASGQAVGDVAVRALRAGCDLLWVPGDAAGQEAAWRAVVRAMRTGQVSAARVADALRRVSVLRARYGVS